MLEQLEVTNLALSAHNCLDFGPGMVAITGETGAGKSLTVDALSLILGARSDPALVRKGCERLEVAARFAVPGRQEVRELLRERALEGEDDTVLLRREITAEGRSRAWVNGHPCALRDLKDIGSLLVVIHGQHEGLRLLEAPCQLALIDSFGHLGDEAAAVAAQQGDYRQLRDALTGLAERQREGAARYRDLKYDLKELEELDLAEGDYEDLGRRFDVLASQGRIESAVGLALGALSSDEGNVIDVLEHRLHDLEKVRAFNEEALGPLLSDFGDALGQLASIRDRLADLAPTADPREVERLSDLLGRCHDLARKHRVRPEELFKVTDRLRSELEEFLALKGKIAALTEEVKAARGRYEELAAALSKDRALAAERLGKEVTALIRELAMPDGAFSVALSRDEQSRPLPQGRDRAEFRFSANLGQEQRPLGEVASGGELSRLSLAIEALTAGSRATPTMLFDEVDTGISGRTASAVGGLLRRLSRSTQIITVTHLPQVAASASSQLRVTKAVEGAEVVSHAEPLDREGRIDEIARMMGGNVVTAATRQGAGELLDGQRD
ncbi:MAG: DNA repair protein RecN [Succinivibrionaceae bacterium]|nr:DNA repair protein RecN [Succinivibrionaceae bacterium]